MVIGHLMRESGAGRTLAPLEPESSIARWQVFAGARKANYNHVRRTTLGVSPEVVRR